jgi:acetylornithine deacetylase/succinyl-diaminopimelate desuccinylase-like protein
VGGGTSVNAIPFEAWMEVDMRSADKAALEALHEKFKTALREAVEEENKRWPGRGTVSVSPEAGRHSGRRGRRPRIRPS